MEKQNNAYCMVLVANSSLELRFSENTRNSLVFQSVERAEIALWKLSFCVLYCPEKGLISLLFCSDFALVLV